MLEIFISALIKDAFIVVRDGSFFETAPKERTKYLHKILGSGYPAAWNAYLQNIDRTAFFEDVISLMPAIVSKESLVRYKNHRFLKAFVQVLQEEVAEAYDSQGTQISLETSFGQALQAIQRGNQWPSLVLYIQRFLRDYANQPSANVQTPMDVSPEVRQRMRQQLNERFPGGFAAFQVERSLLGGMRLFYNGQLTDQSWVAQIQRLFHCFSS